jgi:hypothetical protein
MNKSTWFTGFIAILGWIALVLQFYISIDFYLKSGWSLVKAIIQILSFFTILTNLLIAFSQTVLCFIPRSRLGNFLSKPSIAINLVIYITVVGLVYNLVLRHLWTPQGLAQIADELLHSLIPLLYIVFWVVSVPKGHNRWKNILLGLAYPLGYSIYTLIRGTLTGLYPYPFMDVGIHGYPVVFINMSLVLLLFLFVGLAFLFADGKMSIKPRQKTAYDSNHKGFR